MAEYESGDREPSRGNEIPEDDAGMGAQRIQEAQSGVLRIRAPLQQTDGHMDGPGLDAGGGNGRWQVRAEVHTRGADPGRNVETQESNSPGKRPGGARPRAARVEAAGTVSTAQGTSRTSTEVTHATDGRRFRQSNAASEHKPGVRDRVREARKDF